MDEFWQGLAKRFGPSGRIGIVLGTLLIVVATGVVGYLLLRTDYQVLFADLTPQDTLAMTGELDRLKIPYVLGDRAESAADNLGTIMVNRADVYKTRIKLMGKDIPLHGAIGFELFNNSDLGMTEFAQKINYQRALQGELTRTILSLNEVRDARILLALPEQSFLKQNGNKPKASVTLSMKPGQGLRADQVVGIQRLVASSVAGIAPQDVTIVDQSGVALTRASGDGTQESDSTAGLARLDLKRDMENYLARKAVVVLEGALGSGQASASVDVTLNMDRVQSSTDELVGPPAKPGEHATGVITRERESARDSKAISNPGGETATAGANGLPASGSNQREIDYAVGHRVEQIVSQPGSVRRVQVAVVVKKALTPAQLEQMRQMVAAAVGASFERGDSVVLQIADTLQPSTEKSPAAEPAVAPNDSSETASRVHGPRGRLSGDSDETRLLRSWPIVGALMLIAAVFTWILTRFFRGIGPIRPQGQLSPAERQEVLKRLQHWMGSDQQPRTRELPATTDARRVAGRISGESGQGA